VALEDQFRINLNQNLWALVVAYGALGAAEHWCLKHLFWPSLIASWVLTVLVLASFGYYTHHYCVKKCADARIIKGRLSAKAAARPAENNQGAM
jgi:hypothetical protein